MQQCTHALVFLHFCTALSLFPFSLYPVSMDTAAYWLALVTLVTVPPFMLVWLVIHPLARFWRRVGPVRAYASLGLFIFPLVWILYSFRASLMKVHYGVNWLLVIPAVQILAISMIMGLIRRKHLRPSILFGLPEIRGEDGPEKLLTEGIYSLIRHPRYVEVWLALLAIALFTNYLAVYVLVVLFLPLIWIVVLLEERELRDRFGEQYVRYCARVPRFLPGRRGN